ncbi:penicillin acylase family protein [Luteimonas terricola]|uniref:Penicillin acylase n=1 Tax=Luteimonas terricola TaxID=645597 RepID=A0ABQ2EDG2_9GAMM|nr:penicillin acylase family protein [Luteimonas terricola]GGK06995.1 penicillin acylase [Luteimonas terricola]
MLRWTLRIALLLALLAALAALAAWWALRASLPLLDGNAALRGLSAPVTIGRDAIGVATIDAANETDAMRALGYLHAQERYFEMDLMRRTAAGELSALFGPGALDVDRRQRVHRMRARVDASLDAIAGSRRPLLDAYAEGANAGLADLRARPWPYLLLRQQPAPWTAADTALVGYAMYFDLQDAANAREFALWTLRPHLPPPLYALLTHGGSSWDAPLLGKATGDAVLPAADAVDLRQLPTPEGAEPVTTPRPPAPGSNNFAVSGRLTADGRAIVADDMHLALRAPNIWFRARLRWPDADAPGGRVDVSGFTLPGLPAVVVGSNGHVAWGFTNSYADTLDWSRVTPCGEGVADGDNGCVHVERFSERIEVAGGEPVGFEVEQVAWGPLIHSLDNGDALALRWVAHQPGALNLGLTALASAGDLDRALLLARGIALPAQNLVIGDHTGRVAWRMLGPLPRRSGACAAANLVENDAATGDATAPARADTDTGNEARCAPWEIGGNANPAVATPTVDRVWTANSRVVGTPWIDGIGDGGYVLGARTKQIRDALFASERFDERALLAIQLDDRALFLQRWWELLQASAASAHTPALQSLATAASHWEGRAGPDSVSYRLVRAWRNEVNDRIADGLVAPARAALGDGFLMPALPQLEGTAWPLVSEQPPHLLPRRYDSWQALFEDAAHDVRDQLEAKGPLAQRTWGERNTAAICHPLAGAIPLLGKRLLCMPPDELPGDTAMPLVQGPDFGASQRMVVSPGHEADGIVHMPGGQSGHPLSPFWGAGHDDWVHGRPTPFLPGEARHALMLEPVGTGGETSPGVHPGTGH